MEPLAGLSEATRGKISRVAQALRAETGAISILLTGPQAMGIDGPQDKMYFIAVTESTDGVIEHRFADRYADIDSKMEIGIFPRSFVEKLRETGYWDMVSFRAIEALRLAIPLIDPTGYGADAAEAMVRYLPERRFISGRIHKVVATFDDALSLYSRGDYEGAVLVVREALREAIELVMRMSPASPREKNEDALKAALGDEPYDCLLRALGMDKMSDSEVRDHLEDVIASSTEVLRQLGISEDTLKG